MRREKITNFEEARRCLTNLFCNTTSWKKRPRIVETRTKGLDEEVTYKALLQDLYLSYREDLNDQRTLSEQVEEFNEIYNKLEPGTDKYLVERMILRPEYSNLSEEESKQLRDAYFRKPVRISVVKVS